MEDSKEMEAIRLPTFPRRFMVKKKEKKVATGISWLVKGMLLFKERKIEDVCNRNLKKEHGYLKEINN